MLLRLLLNAAEAAAAAAPPPPLLLIPLFASSLILRLQASPPVPPPSSSLRCSQRSRDLLRPCRCGPAWTLDAALARVARVARVTMGKRGSRSAASSSAGDGDWAAPGAEHDDLTSRVRRWKSQHPARDYGGQPLQHVQPSHGRCSGTLAPSVRCGVYSRTREGQFVGDLVLIPMSRRAPPYVLPVLGESGLLVYDTSPVAFPEHMAMQHTMSVDRMGALAETHPLAATLLPHAKPGWSGRVRDSRGRAKDGFAQSPYHLSVSLAGYGGGKTMYMGLTTKGIRDKDMFGLWWHRAGPDWTGAHIWAARQLFFDVCELDVESVFPMGEADRPWTGGDPTAASGALAGSGGEEPAEVERKETVRWEPSHLVDLEESHSEKGSDSTEEEANSDRSRGSNADPDGSDREDASSGAARGGAFSGARPAGAYPAAPGATRNVKARQVHIATFRGWAKEPGTSWRCSTELTKRRRRRVSRLTEILHQACAPAPGALDVINGIRHFNVAVSDERWDIVRAFATQKLYYLALFRVDFDVPLDEECWLTAAWPHLKRASAGDPHVTCLPPYSEYSPSWKVLRDTFQIARVPDFLKHLFKKHDGEVRLIQDFGWKHLDPVHALHPRFWHPQFARTAEARIWLSLRDSDRSLTWRQAGWVLDTDGGQTTLLRRAPAPPCSRSAASGARAPWQEAFDVEIRVGRVVTLAHLFYLGAEFCSAYDMYKIYMDLPMFVHRNWRKSNEAAWDPKARKCRRKKE